MWSGLGASAWLAPHCPFLQAGCRPAAPLWVPGGRCGVWGLPPEGWEARPGGRERRGHRGLGEGWGLKWEQKSHRRGAGGGAAGGGRRWGLGDHAEAPPSGGPRPWGSRAWLSPSHRGGEVARLCRATDRARRNSGVAGLGSRWQEGGPPPRLLRPLCFSLLFCPPQTHFLHLGGSCLQSTAAAVTVCKPHARVSNFPTGFLKGWFPAGDFSLGACGSPQLQAGCAPGSAAGPGAAGGLCAQRLRQSCDKPRQWAVDLWFISCDD